MQHTYLHVRNLIVFEMCRYAAHILKYVVRMQDCERVDMHISMCRYAHGTHIICIECVDILKCVDMRHTYSNM